MEVTMSQKKVIFYIELNLKIKFEGSTKEEAREFISKHIEESRRYIKLRSCNVTPSSFDYDDRGIYW